LVVKANIVLFDGSGLAEYDHNTNPYFWRMYPADDVAGYAMALVASQKGYKRAAAIFGNDTGSQGTLKTVTKGFQKLGGTIVNTQALALDQSSYRSEIEKMWSANPDVIFMELDAQTAAVFFSQLKQLHSLLPMVGADPTLDSNWFKAVSGAIGAQNVHTYYSGEFPATTTSGAAWDVYSKAVLATPGEPNPQDSTTNSYTEEFYDSTNIVALAMLAAKTTDPTFYNSYIRKVTEASPGAVIVNSFADGKVALLAGKRIQYAGVVGVLDFNQWQNAVGGFDIDGYATDGSIVTIGHLTDKDIAQVQS
jgi:ABC-type branched-subunit amino acid transport system substrate-binding protein